MAKNREAQKKKDGDGPTRSKHIEDLPVSAKKDKQVRGGVSALPIEDYSTTNMMAP